MQAASNLYQEFQTKTALNRLSEEEHNATGAAVEKTKTLLSDIISVAEDQDQKRQLFSLDTSNRGEQVKWPTFGGEPGEDFFKFKKEFLEAATGCPNFAKLGNEQRLVVAREAKFCMKCMGKEVKFSYQHNKECPS